MICLPITAHSAVRLPGECLGAGWAAHRERRFTGQAAGPAARSTTAKQASIPGHAWQKRPFIVHASSRNAPGGPSAPREASERKRVLMKYVKDVQPAMMESFIQQGPTAVVAAMRSTITNMLGTLPPQFFTVTISTLGENLSQLMYSVMMTGYMFRNAQYRLELKGSLGSMKFNQAVAASSSGPIEMVPSSGSSHYAHSILDETTYAPGVQKSRVQGEVLMWHKENGLETMEAVQYMSVLEAEVARLRQQLQAAGLEPNCSTATSSNSSGPRRLPATSGSSAAADAELPSSPPGSPGRSSSPSSSRDGDGPAGVGGPPGAAAPAGTQLPFHLSPQLQQQHGLAPRAEELTNELLEFLRGLEPAGLTSLTSGASNEVRAAMDAFVCRLMGSNDQEQLRRAASDCTAQELGKLMFWLMVVGYTLRSMEVRFDMDRALVDTPGGSSSNGGSSSGGLPPARSW